VANDNQVMLVGNLTDDPELRFNVWRQQAENVAETLQKGARCIVVGRLRTRSWETPEGEKRSVTEVEADEIGPSLKFATAKVERSSRGGSGGGDWNGGGTAGAGASRGGGGGQFNDEPPF
jgi:single-strand DNA-binding protein